ncbi:MAG: glutathione binding-like protein [Burkholderiaceae bacterium]
MIDLYTWSTPNGQKIPIMLEECGLPYAVHPVNIGAGEQFQPQFLAISPNNRIPAIVDSDGPDGKPMALFESGAILVYLAGKTGRFLPESVRGKYQALQWLMWQVGGLGPMLGQANHFVRFAAEDVPYAIDRYTKEAQRLLDVLDRELARHAYLGTDEFTIADIATWPWTRAYAHLGIGFDAHPNVRRWFDAIAARPAVQRAMDVLAPQRRQT